MKNNILLLSMFLYFTFSQANEVYDTETRTKIVVVDSGLRISKEITPYLCKQQLNGYKVTKGGRHGTNISYIIIKDLDKTKYCLTMIAALSDFGMTEFDSYNKEFKKVLDIQNVKYVNLSLNGPGSDETERDIIKKLINKKIHVTVSAGNNSSFLDYNCNTFPACYRFKNEYFHIVGNKTRKDSNYGKVVTEWENGNNINGGGIVLSGTSQAAAVFTNKLIKQKR